METRRFEDAVRSMHEACEVVNSRRKQNDIEFVVLQFLHEKDPYLSDPMLMYKIAHFYNHNWHGNADFMHIPNFEQVEYNCYNYPVIIARCTKTHEIVGISTIKYEENTEEVTDPYYPVDSEKYFSITGILTKKHNKHPGVGKAIYEIALRGHHLFNRKYEDTSIMCVIDCRNANSVNAIYTATESINGDYGTNIVAKISGYYILTDENDEMVEAPTIVLKAEESERPRDPRGIIEYQKDNANQFLSLLNTLKEELTNTSEAVMNMDEECGMVSYYHVNDYNSVPIVIANGTEEGNDRVSFPDTTKQALCRVRNIRRSHE